MELIILNWLTVALKINNMEQLIYELETKEGLISLILQLIKDNPNDNELGEKIRSNFKNYLEEE